jgi:hypothetical protein
VAHDRGRYLLNIINQGFLRIFDSIKSPEIAAQPDFLVISMLGATKISRWRKDQDLADLMSINSYLVSEKRIEWRPKMKVPKPIQSRSEPGVVDQSEWPGAKASKPYNSQFFELAHQIYWIEYKKSPFFRDGALQRVT